MASSHQKTVPHFDPVDDGPINTLSSGDGQTQKLWHIQPGSLAPSTATSLTVLPWSLELLSAPVGTIETQKHPGTLTTALQTLSFKHTRNRSSEQTSQPLLGYWLLLNLLDELKKASQYLHTVQQVLYVEKLSHTCTYTNSNCIQLGLDVSTCFSHFLFSQAAVLLALHRVKKSFPSSLLFLLSLSFFLSPCLLSLPGYY